MHRLSEIKAGCRTGSRTLIGLAFVLSLGAPLSASAADLPGIFGGQAYGTLSKTNLAAVDAALDRIGLVNLSCIGTEGRTISGSVAQLAVPKVLAVGAIASTVFSTKTATSAVAQTVSTIKKLNALGGLITADAVKAVTAVNVTPAAIGLSSAGSSFSNLKIAGIPMLANLPANTKIPLPGYGTLTLRKTSTMSETPQTARGIRVDMLVIDITKSNPLGLSAGSKITLGTAVATFERGALVANLGGEAIGANAVGTVSNTLQLRLGQIAAVSTGCRGTEGKTLSATSTGVDAGSPAKTGAIASSGVAGPTGNAIVVKFESVIQNTRLLGGLIQAGSIHATAQDTIANGIRSSTAGTLFTALRINNKGITAPVPNTRVNIPGFGYVVVNEQVIPQPSSRGRTEANALHVHITNSNALGLLVGTQIIVGHARSLAFLVPQ